MPQKQEQIKLSNFSNIPPQLKELPQWKLCYNEGEIDPQGKIVDTSKRPKGGPRVDLNALTWADVESSHGGRNFGFCLDPFDQIIGIDVDDLPENFTIKDVPKPIKDLLQLNPTYVEVSQSGQGLHIFYKGDKANSDLKYRKANDQGTRFTGAVYLRDQFLMITGNHYKPLSEKAVVSEVDPQTLESLIMKPAKVQSLKPQPVLPQTQQPPSEDEIKAALAKIPPSLSNTPHEQAIRAAYAKFNPPINEVSDYEHWRHIICAVHHAMALNGKAEAGVELVDTWSQYDENYDGYDSVRTKYYDNPPKFDGTDVTFFTLIALKNAATINWPYKKYVKGELANIPIPNNVLNWEALVKHYGLEIMQNAVNKEYTVTGNDYIIREYFSDKEGNPFIFSSLDTLKNTILRFAQATEIPAASLPNAEVFVSSWVHREVDEYNPIKRWIESAPEYNPKQEPDYMDQLWNFITLDPDAAEDEERVQLYKTYLKKNLMGIIRAHFYGGPFSESTGIVIFIGPENARKSTFVKALLPREFEEYVYESALEMKANTQAKEVQMEIAKAQIWIKDEAEGFLSMSGSALKKYTRAEKG